jgi:hypothetical protein
MYAQPAHPFHWECPECGPTDFIEIDSYHGSQFVYGAGDYERKEIVCSGCHEQFSALVLEDRAVVVQGREVSRNAKPGHRYNL